MTEPDQYESDDPFLRSGHMMVSNREVSSSGYESKFINFIQWLYIREFFIYISNIISNSHSWV